jgi:hypothetical protein
MSALRRFSPLPADIKKRNDQNRILKGIGIQSVLRSHKAKLVWSVIGFRVS